jgi:hypothetical protein
VDSFDPTGAQLRALIEDGVTLGAYSVGTDGEDDEGDKEFDRRFLLYAPSQTVNAD